MDEKKIYEEKVRPLIENRDYGSVSDLLIEYSGLMNRLSKDELKAMVGYYQDTILGFVHEVLGKTSRSLDTALVVAEESRKPGVRN